VGDGVVVGVGLGDGSTICCSTITFPSGARSMHVFRQRSPVNIDTIDQKNDAR
jgi:hypothetical protein